MRSSGFSSSSLAGLLALLAWPLSAIGWEVQSFGGREHIPVSEIAAFYGLGSDEHSEENAKTLKGSGRELSVTRDSREVTINGIRHWLAFPIVESGGRLFVSRLDLGKTIEPAFRPAFIPDFPAVTTVVLDPGHGGKDRGAQSPYEWEKNFALDVARRVRDQLTKAGLRVLMTRNSDVFIELPERAAVANRLKSVIFVSLHFNAADWNQEANGFEIFCVTPRGAPSTAYEQTRIRDMVQESGNDHDLHSFALANTVYHAMHGKLEMTDRGVKRARFAVLRQSGVPSVLIEGGFLTNPADARRVASKQWRDSYAAAIAQGILEYKKLAEQKLPPREVAAYRNPASAPRDVASSPPSQPIPVSGITLREIPHSPAANP